MVQGPRGKEAALAFVLVVVKVADEVVVDVEDVRDDAVLLEAHGGELRVEGEGVAGLAVLGDAAVDIAHALVVLDLPLAPHAVDESVVEEEDRVTGGAVHRAHDGANAVVAEGVGARN